jgi:hypothetical protein
MQLRERDRAVGCMRRAQLEFDQRCTQLQVLSLLALLGPKYSVYLLH